MTGRQSGEAEARVGLRIETWVEGTARHLVAVLERDGYAEAWRVRADSSEATVLCGFGAKEGWTPGDALRPFVPESALRPATARTLASLLTDRWGSSFHELLKSRVPRVRSRGKNPGFVGHSWVSSTTSLDFERARDARAAGNGCPPPEALGAFGYSGEGDGCCPLLRPGEKMPLSVGVAWDEFPPDALDEAMAFLRGGIDLDACALLGRLHWSARAHRYYAVGGDLGHRRAQAAALYPAFAPLIAVREAVSRLVDAGRPFEDALRAAVSAMHGLPGDRGLSRASLRRMRTLPRDACVGQLLVAVEIAARLPHDRLPGTEEEWAAAQSVSLILLPFIDALGIPLRRALGPGPGAWRAHWTNQKYLYGRPEANEMAFTLIDTLVCKFLPGKRNDKADIGIALAVLFSDKTLRGAHALWNRWERGGAAFRAALPARGRKTAWPALFAPFGKRLGVRLTCLADEASLAAEDVDGRHLIHGYAGECHAGELHVAAVTVFGRTLSTVAFSAGQGPDGRTVLEVCEHAGRGGRALPDAHPYLGRRYREPPALAVAAVNGFVAAVERGDVALNPEALNTEGRGRYDAWCDLKVPGNLEAVFEAWKPYLPRAIAKGGLQALAERVTALAEERRAA